MANSAKNDPMSDNSIPKTLRLIIQEAKRRRSPEEEDAANRFVLRHATLAEYLVARQTEPRGSRWHAQK